MASRSVKFALHAPYLHATFSEQHFQTVPLTRGDCTCHLGSQHQLKKTTEHPFNWPCSQNMHKKPWILRNFYHAHVKDWITIKWLANIELLNCSWVSRLANDSHNIITSFRYGLTARRIPNDSIWRLSEMYGGFIRRVSVCSGILL